jgi:hypothetical protein
MAKLAKSKSKKDSGNVTVVDLGEEVDKHMNRRIDQKLQAAGVVGKGSKETMAGSFGYRPWYADKGSSSKYGHLMGSSYSDRWKGLSRPNLGHLAIGAGIGVLGNAALVRVTPDLVKTDSALAHDAIAFVVGLIPVFAKPNSYTLGVAVPGAIKLGLSICSYGLDALGVKKPALSGAAPAAPRVGMDAARAAQQKLAAVHQAMQRPAVPAAAASAPVQGRVTAQAVG